jgi:hypothetical protein
MSMSRMHMLPALLEPCPQLLKLTPHSLVRVSLATRQPPWSDFQSCHARHPASSRTCDACATAAGTPARSTLLLHQG